MHSAKENRRNQTTIKTLLFLELFAFLMFVFFNDIYPLQGNMSEENTEAAIKPGTKRVKKYFLSLELDMLDGLTFSFERRFKLFE
jgi:hypothetical protein